MAKAIQLISGGTELLTRITLQSLACDHCATLPSITVPIC